MHLYVHIPFCKQACHYCDFHFSTNLKQKAELVAALVLELTLQRDYLSSRQLETIYFGGGTPSLLTERELSLIFEEIHRLFSVEKDAEITLEANPDDLTTDKLRELKPFVNRLSIGLQSFHEPYLRLMNRAHKASEGISSVKQAQDAGFTNLTLDLIYGMSEQNFSEYPNPAKVAQADAIWQDDLDQAVALNVPHISAYNLTIEEKTPLGRWLKKGKINAVDDERSARHFELLTSTLNAANYEQYEISNFARNRQYARHNSSYWKRRSYLGIGPSAHSFNGSSRQYNVSNNALYIKSIQGNTIPCEVEYLSIYDQVNDYLLTSLRTRWGCDLRVIRAISGLNFEVIQKKYIYIFIQKGWLRVDDEVLYLTQTGKLFADRIVSDLFLV